MPHAVNCNVILYTGQGALLAFYKRFLESPNFTAWFERQREAAWAWQEAEWTAAAAIRGEGADLSGLDEVQVGAQAWVQHDQVTFGYFQRPWAKVPQHCLKILIERAEVLILQNCVPKAVP